MKRHWTRVLGPEREKMCAMVGRSILRLSLSLTHASVKQKKKKKGFSSFGQSLLTLIRDSDEAVAG